MLICRLLCSRLSVCLLNLFVTLQAVEKAKARQAAIAARATARGSGRVDNDDASSSRSGFAALLDDSDAESESDDDVDDSDDGDDDATEDNVASSADAAHENAPHQQDTPATGSTAPAALDSFNPF